VNRFSGLQLTLSSRVAAVGKAGLASIDLLCGHRQLVTGSIVRHDHLVVAHLGPGLLEVPGSVDDYLSAANTALDQCPHVVILDEGRAANNEAWNLAYSILIGSEAMLSFRGALVICVAEETDLVRSICSHRWIGAGEWLWQDDVKEHCDLETLEDVLNMPDQTVLDEPFMQELRDLAWQDFKEDIIEDAKKKGWSLTVLTRPGPRAILQDGSQAICETCNDRELAGFMFYVIRGTSFHIARLAVAQQFRKAGYGRRLMRWALEKAAEMPRSQVAWIACSALDTAVPFYENFGFMDMTADAVDEEGHFQTWMEMKNISNVCEDVEPMAPPFANL
jgi:ribosomal protein S18 acetylase RimI-like enzyme